MAIAAGLASKSAFSIGADLIPWMQVSQARPELVGLRAIFCSINFDPLYVFTTVFPFTMTPISADEGQLESSAVWLWSQDLASSVRRQIDTTP